MTLKIVLVSFGIIALLTQTIVAQQPSKNLLTDTSSQKPSEKNSSLKNDMNDEIVNQLISMLEDDNNKLGQLYAAQALAAKDYEGKAVKAIKILALTQS